jgi:hypothetical protein
MMMMMMNIKKNEVEKQEKLFKYLISIGFDKLLLKDTSNKSVKEDLIIFRHNEFCREALLSFTVYNNDGINIDYENTKEFLNDWGFLDDDELEMFQQTFLDED